jgi:dTDP-glucose 4,6-dehydratase
MKKIIVTGGSGFIGSNLVQFLLKKKYFVINIDKSNYSANPYNVKEFKKNKNYLFFKLDINKKKKIFKILKKYRPIGIFNLAAETHVDRSIDSAENFLKSNVFGVYNLLEVLRKLKKNRKKQIKLLHVSTDEVYGDLEKNKFAKENTAYNPSSPYSASKASADQLVKAYTRTYGIKTVIANPCNNYGPNQFPEKFIPKIIFNILNNRSLPLYGNGKNVREWIFVKDNCEALLKIFLKGKIGKNYNIGTGIRLKNIDIVKKLLDISKNNKIKLSDKTKIKFVMDRPGHDERYALDSTKIKREIRWKHKTTISIGLSKTINWYLKNLNFYKKISKRNITKRLGVKV